MRCRVRGFGTRAHARTYARMDHFNDQSIWCYWCSPIFSFWEKHLAALHQEKVMRCDVVRCGAGCLRTATNRQLLHINPCRNTGLGLASVWRGHKAHIRSEKAGRPLGPPVVPGVLETRRCEVYVRWSTLGAWVLSRPRCRFGPRCRCRTAVRGRARRA